jgi:N-methylhydantoinase A
VSSVIGVDVGGTFTDLILYDEAAQACSVAKVLSTPGNQARGLLNGIVSLGVALADVAAIVHGTTVATNALLERKGARLALIATRGFRDVAELHTRERPSLYGLRGKFDPLIPRDLRFEVLERVDTNGHVLQPLDGDELRALAARIRALDVAGVVVAFINCFANPANENAARAILEKFFPPEAITLSSEVLPSIGEFERTSTAIVNAYVQPLVGGYLDTLEGRLAEKGFRDSVLVVQSNGGIASSAVAARTAVSTVLSGPAAGVVAGSQIARAAGFERCITCDMGGTSFDVCLIDGAPTMANRKQLEFGLPVGMAMIDIATVGAGGGSIAHLDARGFLAVGPQSTGAMPGPACYGRGGMQPTVTDANLLLGRLNPELRPGTDAELALDVERAREAVGALGKRLGMDTAATAQAIVAIANRNMAASIRLVSVERGYDPRDFVLVVFGGAGPLHATALMRELGTSRALIPFYPGLGCAIGCVMADLRHEFSSFIDRPVAELDPARLREIVSEHQERGRALLAKDRAAIESVGVLVEADMAYAGQLNTVRVQLPGRLEPAAIIEAFRSEYQKLYRRLLDPQPIRIVSLRSSIVGMRPKVDLKKLIRVREDDGPAQSREVCFGDGYVRTPVRRRASMPPGTSLEGPAVIESDDATVVVDPGVSARVDAWGNLLLEIHP